MAGYGLFLCASSGLSVCTGHKFLLVAIAWQDSSKQLASWI